MTGRTYGQICGLARALELVGERWSMLIVRDLVLGPKRFTDLHGTLPRIPSSILSSRLNELEAGGVVRRRVLPHLEAAVVYELTEYGSELEDIVLQLGLWGARSLNQPNPDDIFTLDSAILSLYTTFRPESARGVRVNYELHFGDMIVHAFIDDGDLKVSEGPHPDADLIIEALAPIKPLYSREITPRQALENGMVRVTGDPALLDRFVELFHIPPAPQPSEGLTVS